MVVDIGHSVNACACSVHFDISLKKGIFGRDGRFVPSIGHPQSVVLYDILSCCRWFCN